MIRRFQPGDLARLAGRSAAARRMASAAPNLEELLAQGEAWAALVGDPPQPWACAGVATIRPGVGEAWAVFADGIAARRATLGPLKALAGHLDRRLAALLAAGAWHRIEARCAWDDPRAVAWARRCGFGAPEALLHRESPDGRDTLLYARWTGKGHVEVKHSGQIDAPAQVDSSPAEVTPRLAGAA